MTTPPTGEQASQFDLLLPLLNQLYHELTELNKKNSNAFLSELKIRHVNRILKDVQKLLQNDESEPYLELLDEESNMVQNSDAVIVIGQWKTAMTRYKSRYSVRHHGKSVWQLGNGGEQESNE